MSDQFYPSVPSAATPVIYAPVQGTSVWRIAAATFVGILLCQLIAFAITACFYFGVFALALSRANR